jgi:hypothetical protein
LTDDDIEQRVQRYQDVLICLFFERLPSPCHAYRVDARAHNNAAPFFKNGKKLIFSPKFQTHQEWKPRVDDARRTPKTHSTTASTISNRCSHLDSPPQAAAIEPGPVQAPPPLVSHSLSGQVHGAAKMRPEVAWHVCLICSAGG